MTAPADAPPLSPQRAFGWSVLFLVVGFALSVVLGTVAVLLTGGIEQLDAGPRTIVIQTFSGLLAFGFTTWAVGMRGARLTLTDLRWKPTTLAGRGFVIGLGLGAAAAVAAMLLSLVVGDAAFLPDAGGVQAYLLQVGSTALLLAPAALVEEVVFRGVAQVLLARIMGRFAAITTLSLLFALAHLGNPNSTPLGLLNIALAGIFLGAAFYLPGGIWTAWGAHLGWNTALAALDAPVSGLPFRIPLIDYAPGGPAWLTGGTFGPEGGLLATITILLATVVAWRGNRKELA